MRLYTYYRSSAAFRVRIALELKGLTYEAVPVHLARGEQHRDGYAAVNPQQLIPVLEHDGLLASQSLAIVEYLEETHPTPPLLPVDAAERAWVRALALTVVCDIHPLNNLRVLQYLKHELSVDEARRDAWYRHWVRLGLEAVEAQLVRGGRTGRFCHGDAPTIADCCLVPQIFNAVRFECPLTDYPTLMRVHQNCMTLESFQRAAPQNQPDAER